MLSNMDFVELHAGYSSFFNGGRFSISTSGTLSVTDSDTPSASAITSETPIITASATASEKDTFPFPETLTVATSGTLSIAEFCCCIRGTFSFYFWDPFCLQRKTPMLFQTLFFSGSPTPSVRASVTLSESVFGTFFRDSFDECLSNSDLF